jgi:hypothetical protein
VHKIEDCDGVSINSEPLRVCTLCEGVDPGGRGRIEVQIGSLEGQSQ